jgi:hypothetical protein
VNTKRSSVILLLAMLACWAVPAQADPVAIGFLSFDPFIGTNAFDLYNLTGPVYGPLGGADPYASDSLTFGNAMLTLNPDGGTSTTIDLGDVGPGELLDSSGNPVVQVPGDENFLSATFTATLAPASFSLFDASTSTFSTFDAATAISVSLTPSAGPDLEAGTDFAVIFADPAPVTPPNPVPEPPTGTLLVSGMLGFFCLLRIRARPICG